MPSNEVPQAVLAEQLAEQIDGRKVRAAVFTTFTFDPGFFELHVLPTLFDIPFSQIEKVKRIQLDDALRTVEEIAVYYDRTALAQDATPAQLDFQRIGVRRPQGVFHPKLILVLVENPLEEDVEDPKQRGPESLIVGCLSANLTRAGWWENLEVGHFEVMDDKNWTDDRYPFRKDLLELTRRILDLSGPVAEQQALDRIRRFLLKRTPTQMPRNNSVQGRHYTRLFIGQSALPAWLEEVRLDNGHWNLEVISPYFDSHNTKTLEHLIAVIGPREIRIFLPQDQDGAAHVTPKLYDVIAGYAKWCVLPSQLTRPGARAATRDAAPRFVHAKIYRLWRSDGKQVVLVGSVNLTHAAHSRISGGNLEASFLVDVSDAGIPKRWWLQRLDVEPTQFVDEDLAEDDEAEEVFIDLSFRFDWGLNQLSYRVEEGESGHVSICDPSGRKLFVIDKLDVTGQWVVCEEMAAELVRELLTSTSFLQVLHAKGAWRVLIRETGMNHRPSLLTTLTSEEILLYWSLLTPTQREILITETVGDDGELQGLTTRTHRYVTGDTLFDRFAGVYHAFEQSFGHISDCLDRGDIRDAEARLFGAKYDSLPELLRKTHEQNQDPVMRYIIFLCARQICERVKRYDGEFWKTHRQARKHIEEYLSLLPQLASELPLEADKRQEFLDWYESMFVRMIQQPEAIA